MRSRPRSQEKATPPIGKTSARSKRKPTWPQSESICGKFVNFVATGSRGSIAHAYVWNDTGSAGSFSCRSPRPAGFLTLRPPAFTILAGPGLHVKVRALGGGPPLPQYAYDKPIPAPSPETARYWEGCRAHELWLPFCRSCQRFFFYPRRFSPQCFGWAVEGRQGSGR